MKDHVFLDREGTPQTGKIPVFIRYSGPQPRATSEVNGLINTFLTELRVSALAQLTREYLFSEGTIRITHKFGTTQVEVRTRGSSSRSGSRFYGGILIQPTYIADPVYFSADAAGADPARTIPKSVESSGARPAQGLGPALPGRPGGPGVNRSTATNWLVVQIAGDRPLGATPIASGTVRIFRLKDPLFGDIAEVNNTPGTYLLSTNGYAVTGSAATAFKDFYLCGKRVTTIPGLPTLSTLECARSESGFVRLRTFGFTKEWDTASAARGVVILATKGHLFAIDTRRKNATWQTLAASELQFQNAYGSDFTETVQANGSVVITCSGSNGAGVCSGFSVTIAPTGITGQLNLMADGSTPGAPATVSFTKTVTAAHSTDTHTISPTYCYPSYAWDPVNEYYVISGVSSHTTSYEFNARVTSFTNTTTFSYTAADPGNIVDQFAGGSLPRVARPLSISYDWAMTRSGSIGGWVIIEKGHGYGSYSGLVGIYPDNSSLARTFVSYIDNDEYRALDLTDDLTPPRRPSYGPAVSESVSVVGNMQITGSRSDVNVTYVSTTTRSGITGAYPPVNPADAWAPQTFSSTGSVTGATTSLPLHPNDAFQYIAKEQHTQSLALDLTSGRAGAFGPIVINPGLTESGLESLLSGASTYSGISHDSIARSYTEQSNAITLRTPSATLFSWPDYWTTFAARHPATLAYADTQFANLVLMTSIPPEPMVGVVYERRDSPSFSNLYYGMMYEFISTYVTPTVDDPAVGGARYGTNSGDNTRFHVSIPFTYSTSVTVASPGNLSNIVQYATTIADYAAKYPASGYALLPSTVPSPGDTLIESVGPGVSGPLPPQEYVPLSAVDTLSFSLCRIYRDLRTQGYIFQVHWKIQTAPPMNSLQTRIGNQYGSVPLTDVLREWAALGSVNNGSVDYIESLSHVFVDEPQGRKVALL